LFLKIRRKTVGRKIVFLAERARERNNGLLVSLKKRVKNLMISSQKRTLNEDLFLLQSESVLNGESFKEQKSLKSRHLGIWRQSLQKKMENATILLNQLSQNFLKSSKYHNDPMFIVSSIR
jgi:hypothetical protein